MYVLCMLKVKYIVVQKKYYTNSVFPLGMIISTLLNVTVIHYNLNISWLYLSDVLRSCIGGGEIGIRIAAMAYVIDISKDRKTLALKLGKKRNCLCTLYQNLHHKMIAKYFDKFQRNEILCGVGYSLWLMSLLLV